jgi:pimeloyl-ACP methyl ester carboxylesterase
MKTKIFLTMSIILSFQYSLANCRADAQRAKQNGNNHLVITFEGLLSGSYTHTYNLAKKANTQTGNRAKIYSYSHAGGPAISVNCVRDWKAVHGDHLRLTVAGHSFGGNAAMRLANTLNGEGTTIANLVILDGRDGSESFACRSLGKSYQRPPNVVQATAIYQNGCLAGRSFTSDPQSKSLQAGTSHIGVPYGEVARREMVDIFSSAAAQNPDVIALDSVPVASNNAESDGQEGAPAEVYSQPHYTPTKIYKCELPHTPGLFKNCSREERMELNKLYPKNIMFDGGR